MAGYKTRLKRSWKFIVAIIAPIVLLPVLFVQDNEMIHDSPYGTTADNYEEGVTESDDPSDSMKKSPVIEFTLFAVDLVMAVYWALEIIPLPITSLFPLVLFPLFGIDDAANVSKSYMKESNTIFLGGAIVALAVEFCNLHRRVALRLITIVGVSPRRLMFGIMAVVSFLSMWISNTTCTTMLVPIIVAIVDEIHEVTDATNSTNTGTQGNTAETTVTSREPPQQSSRIRSQSITPTTTHHTLAFANASLSSHHGGRGTIPVADLINDQRSTLGLLEGHRPHAKVRERLYPNRNKIQTANISQLHIPNDRTNVTNPLHTTSQELQSVMVSGRRASTPNVTSSNLENNFNYLRRSSACSIAEPGRIENFINLPSPASSECEDDVTERNHELEREKWRNIKNMYLFALAYAANIGGTATITGTGPNKVFKEAIKPYSYDISQDGKYHQMTFFTWISFNLPAMLVNNLIAWLYLNIKYCGFPKFSKSPQYKAEHALKKWKEQQVRSYLMQEYKKLGKMKFHEIGVGAVFLLVVFLWILRDPQIFTGWHEVVSDTQAGDSTAALLGAVLLFIVPRSWAFLTSKDDASCDALIDWSFVTKKLPWGVLLLLGSGYAIGDSVVKTGLARWIGEELYLLHGLPKPLLLLIVMLITAFITEVVSNTACASIILPVLLGLSHEMKVHPLYLSVPAAVTASYAFMLPVASPINAIVFAAGDFSIWEMITNGYILNGICVLIFYLNTLTLGECLFDFSKFTYPNPPSPPPTNFSVF